MVFGLMASSRDPQFLGLLQIVEVDPGSGELLDKKSSESQIDSELDMTG